jgi:hypothetical protein
MPYEPPAINFHLGETPPREPQGGGEPTKIAAPLSINSLESLRALFTERIGGAAEYIVIPALALVAALIAFGIFVALFGKNPLDLYFYTYQGASAPGSPGRTR